MPAGNEIARLRRHLLARRRKIVDLQQNLNACLDDFQFRDPELEKFAKGTMLLNSREEELQVIERALQKMDTGGYGVCESCGGDIALKRLEALPSTAVCFDCATRGEKGKRARADFHPDWSGTPEAGIFPVIWRRMMDRRFSDDVYTELFDDNGGSELEELKSNGLFWDDNKSVSWRSPAGEPPPGPAPEKQGV